MSTQFITAKQGYHFQITNAGRQVMSIRSKYLELKTPQYRYRVPKTWVTKGYVEEVKDETM